jgi:hypothetical protein
MVSLQQRRVKFSYGRLAHVGGIAMKVGLSKCHQIQVPGSGSQKFLVSSEKEFKDRHRGALSRRGKAK